MATSEENELHRFAREGRWNEFRHRMRTHRSELFQCNSCLESPLHYAVAYGAPASVVTRLLCVNPASCMNRNAMGMLPLHYASFWCAPSDVLALLLRHNVDTVRVRDGTGRTALDLAWVAAQVAAQTGRIFPILDDHFARDANEDDSQAEGLGQLRTGLSSSLLELEHDILRTRWPRVQSTHSNFPSRDHAVSWSNIEILIKATYHGTMEDPIPDGKKWRFVHAVAAVQCNPRLMKLALKLYPEQVKERDEYGRLPLHVACRRTCIYRRNFEEVSSISTSDNSNKSDDGDSEDTCHGSNVANESVLSWNDTETILDPLLDMYPLAASCVHPADGSLPIFFMLRCGRRWEGGIQRIVRAEPSALSKRDAKTGLYPFMLAASAVMDNLNEHIRGSCNVLDGRSKTSMKGNEKEKARYCRMHCKRVEGNSPRCRRRTGSCGKKASGSSFPPDLTTVFELLRSAPEMVWSGIGEATMEFGKTKKRRFRRHQKLQESKKRRKTVCNVLGQRKKKSSCANAGP